MTLNQLTALIVGWANDRNLLEGSDWRAQCIKLGEELCMELAEAAEEDNELEIKDAVGDCYVVATIMAAQLGGSITLAREDAPILAHGTVAAYGHVCANVARGKKPETLAALGVFVNTLEDEAADSGDFSLLECVEGAWNTIKDRKGRMVDGVFIKEGE